MDRIKRSKEKYVCACACGRAFTTAYPTTPLCPACCEAHLGMSYQPDNFYEPDTYQPEEEGGLFLAAGFLLSRPFHPDGAGQWGACREGRKAPSLAVLVAVALLFAIGFALSGGQAEMQGWDQ